LAQGNAQDGNEGTFSAIDSTRTDENGRFQFPSRNGRFILLAEDGGHAVSSANSFFSNSRNANKPDGSRTVFFTDRGIYRPGQSIQYKGITLRYDFANGKYSVVAGSAQTVVFSDPNGKEIARATHETNDYGSFSGTFTAPRDRLTGSMTIQVLGQPMSRTAISVEEYKRPKFQVEIDPPREAARLASPVELTGKATAYTGAAIGGARVKWRVERSVALPRWCWWWRPPATQAIGHGTGVTAPDGTFKVQFSADPDRSVPAENEPTFVFTLYVDVTDTTGETRSDYRMVRAGYTALRASVTAGDWQTPDKPIGLAVETTSLDGDPQSARGTVTIYALKQPRKVERAVYLIGGRDFGADRSKADPANPDSWDVGRSVAIQAFKTDATGKAQVAARLKAGIYRASLETTDRFGKKVTARQTVRVVDPGARHYGVKQQNLVVAPKWSVESGEKFTALWGTGYDTGRAFVELECNGKPLKSYWTASNRTQELIELPITEEMRGGVSMRVTYIRENRAYTFQRIIDVPWSNKHLTVTWEYFRSKLMPGQKETWTAVVTGPDSKRTAAEMVASLYDASLDQYPEPNWWWYRAPIETQALMIEAFDEVSNDAQAVEACKVWLLKQKQTQSWKTTKATADAIYALLLRGEGLLSSDALVEVALVGETIKPEMVEAGTGFYEQKFVRNEVKPAMGRITVTKTDDGVSWGAIHWQYLEDMAKVTPNVGTPLKLKKTLFIKETTKKGQVLVPVSGPLSVGDELVVRIELRTDRDMEYVHLKDQRASGTEPVEVLSGYRFEDGLAYYESTRDTASHFFIDYLPKGVYVFEYSTRVQLRGSYQTGIAEVQCMYAPEFNSHSESFALEVK
jgi:uncharacterized protein YfaS (alpha-2-macroglobulin family)